MLLSRTTAILLAASLLPNTVEAAGYYIADVGVQGMARGGAFIAGPDSLLALHYNPGALTLLGPGAHALIVLQNVNLDFEVTRTCPCVDPSLSNRDEANQLVSSTFRPATNTAASQDVPYIAVGYGLPWKNLTVALGVYGLTSPGRMKLGERNAPPSTRYSLVDLELFEAFYNLAIAIEPIEGLRVGFTGILYDFNVTQAVNLYANTVFLDPGSSENFENQQYDIPLVLQFEAPTRLSFGAGISYSPSFLNQLSVGASVLGRRSVRADGTATITVPRSLTDLGVSIMGNQIEVELNLSPIFRFGIQWDQPELFEIEAAAVIEGWAAYDRVVVRGKDIVANIRDTQQGISRIELETNYRNTYSLRFGGELKVLEPYLGVRAGAFFEPSAVEDRLRESSSPDLQKLGFSLGLATTWYGLTLELAGTYVTMSTVEISDSERMMVGALDPPNGNPDLLTTIGNGTYSGSYVIVGASLGASFDTLVKSMSSD
jgi:hypothetical protein